MSERELSWSCSRADVFSRCRLEYWFNYTFAHGGWDPKADFRKRECHVLKHTKNRYAWMGDLVHEGLEEFFREYAEGRLIAREALAVAADRKMRAQFRESRDQAYRLHPGRCTGLMEHENAVPVTDDQWKRIHDNVMNCVNNFFLTPFFKKHILEEKKPLFRMEKLDHYYLDDIRVYAKPDAAYKDGETLKIIDWKTGEAHDEHEFQLLYYILYGTIKLGYPAGCVEGSLIYLKNNLIKKVEVLPGYLDNAMEHLRKSFAEMKAFDEALKAGLPEEEIPSARAASVCAQCRFQKICNKRITAAEPAS